VKWVADAILLSAALFAIAVMAGKRLKRLRQESEFLGELDRIGRDAMREEAYRRAGLREVPDSRKGKHV
jgi:hypothetical protein